MKRILLFVILFICSTSLYAQISTLSLNNSIAHTFTKGAATVAVDHELVYGWYLPRLYHGGDDSWIFHVLPSVSAEYSYYPINGLTYHNMVVNANINYTLPEIKCDRANANLITPFVGISASYCYIVCGSFRDKGFGISGVIGAIFPFSEQVSMTMQYKYYHNWTETFLGHSMIQTGISFNIF